MTRTRTFAALAGLGLAVGLVGGQPPATKDPKPATAGGTAKTASDALLFAAQAAPAKGSLEEAIAKALQSHPDLRVAEAEVQVAQAKLAQSRLVITQKVSDAYTAVQSAKAAMGPVEETFKVMEQLVKSGQGSRVEFLNAQAALLKHRAELARAEAELKVLLGTPPGGSDAAVRVRWDIEAVRETTTWRPLTAAQCGSCHSGTGDARFRTMGVCPALHPQLTPAVGTVADKLKAALDKPVKLDAQSAELKAILDKLFQTAGLDVRVRLPITEDPRMVQRPTRLSLDAGELPLRVWLQLVLDETSNQRNFDFQASPNAGAKPLRYDLYVREYGLLLCTPDLAPPDAITVTQLGKQAQAEKAAAEKKGEATK